MPDEMNQQPVQQTQIPEQQQVQNLQPVQNRGTSGMGVASLVLGILAILTSFLPIINNGSFFLAILGLIFAIVGIVVTKNGKKSGRGLAIAGLVLNILSIAIVLFTQNMYSAAIDSAVEEMESGSKPVATTQAQKNDAITTDASSENAGPEAENSETAQGEQSAAEQQEDNASEADYSNLALGEAVSFKNGMSVSVDAVITGLTKYNDDPITGITVTYTNNGDKNESFNPYDWKAQDANGVIDSMTYIMDGENELSSGQLTPGSSITGNIYFDGEIVKAYYYDNIFQSDSEVAWNLQ